LSTSRSSVPFTISVERLAIGTSSLDIERRY
jgi:hypothetical protein